MTLKVGDHVLLNVEGVVEHVGINFTDVHLDGMDLHNSFDTAWAEANLTVLAPPLPDTLTTVIRSKYTGLLLTRLRAGWVDLNLEVRQHADLIPEEWDVLYTPEAQ